MKTCTVINEGDTMNNIIFKYTLKDAFNFPLSELYVTNDEKGNLHLIKDDNEKVITINTKVFSTILEKYENEFKEAIKEEVPNAPVLDGYINEISFKVNDKVYNDAINNLGFYDDNEVDNNKHLSTVLDMLDELYEELYKQNKDVEKYFMLCELEEEYTE